jgi:nicotinate-nucleotide adenylyltransferase
MKRVGLYFGSFNPVHTGHIHLAKYLTDNNLVDEVWFVISPCNPLKDQAGLIDEYQRLDMLMLAIKDNPRFKVCDIEFTMPIPSYTVDTLAELHKQFADIQFTLLIGSDNVLVFDQWKSPDLILANYPVLVYPRKGYNFAEVATQYPQMKLLNSPFFEVSSTQIREAVAQKKDATQWLHPSVYQFIQELDLYKNGL